jgi:hypothetical protein
LSFQLTSSSLSLYMVYAACSNRVISSLWVVVVVILLQCVWLQPSLVYISYLFMLMSFLAKYRRMIFQI